MPYCIREPEWYHNFDNLPFVDLLMEHLEIFREMRKYLVRGPNVHAPHPASGVSRRTLEGMLFCLGRATQSNYDGSEHHNLQELWTFELQLPGCKQDPAKTKYDEA